MNHDTRPEHGEGGKREGGGGGGRGRGGEASGALKDMHRTLPMLCTKLRCHGKDMLHLYRLPEIPCDLAWVATAGK
jgi:hypothetical protein